MVARCCQCFEMADSDKTVTVTTETGVIIVDTCQLGHVRGPGNECGVRYFIELRHTLRGGS